MPRIIDTGIDEHFANVTRAHHRCGGIEFGQFRCAAPDAHAVARSQRTIGILHAQHDIHVITDFDRRYRLFGLATRLRTVRRSNLSLLLRG